MVGILKNHPFDGIFHQPSYRQLKGILPMEISDKGNRHFGPVGLGSPSGYVKIVIENGHRNSGFSH